MQGTSPSPHSDTLTHQRVQILSGQVRLRHARYAIGRGGLALWLCATARSRHNTSIARLYAEHVVTCVSAGNHVELEYFDHRSDTRRDDFLPRAWASHSVKIWAIRRRFYCATTRAAARHSERKTTMRVSPLINLFIVYFLVEYSVISRETLSFSRAEQEARYLQCLEHSFPVVIVALCVTQ